jgi:uncharacterized repeat protein (TIGR01451 family)/LPXTG-motif cell wall-anchored protein
MKVSKVLAVASLTGVVAASAIASPALAWHPKGVIKKSVQNQTTGSALSDANTASAAVAAKPGDTLKYVIEVSNTGSTGTSNEMHFTKLTDTLPAGVELIADPAKRAINEDLGVVKPGQKVTKEYLVKVTSTKNNDLIENKACFTGDSEVKDNPQDGCDVADVKVTVPKTEEPKPEPKPEQPKPQTPAPQVQAASVELPQTGASSVIAPLAAITSGVGAYAGRVLYIKRRQK